MIAPLNEIIKELPGGQLSTLGNWVALKERSC